MILMMGRRNLLCFLFLIIMLVESSAQSKDAIPPPEKKWLTLSGVEPLVIARGGFSGLFPDSSEYAFSVSNSITQSIAALYCDVQLTKDGIGICQTNIRLDNSTNIAAVFHKDQKTYNINGETVQGWFALDFTADQIFKGVTLNQNIYSRPSLFDDQYPMSKVEDAASQKPMVFWLNVQYDMFYKQHNLDVGSFIQTASRRMGINYISSPEVGFLKSLNGKINNKARTKFIFRFLEADAIEPTTKQTYGSILKDLASIKNYASGILVPKNYIWPVTADNYLEAHTSLVNDAHKLGLEVYASGFANDMPGSFNYSYDPSAEYLQFIDNSEFAVDGVLTDFPPTALGAITCLAQNDKAKPAKGQALIISHNGASGIFPASTDLAYQQAVDDGADIIDCSVQMSKDGVAFCLESADLAASTTAMTTLMPKATTVPEIQEKSGIFSFDLTWSEIQTVKPQLTGLKETGLPRNPANKNKGKLMQLSEFLDLAKTKAVSGVLINIRNAAFLASKKGLSITDAVTSALSNATLDKQSTQQVLIQSDDTSVLSKFKNIPAYKRVLQIDETIGGAPKQSIDEIKKFADAVNLPRSSLVVTRAGFTTSYSDIVDNLHAANISTYVSVLRNEYSTIAFDFFSDPTVELATYVLGLTVDGVVTEYPATARRYMRSPCCADPENQDRSFSILPAEAGGLLSVIPEDTLPPAAAPAGELQPADVVDPPLPPVVNVVTTPGAPAPGAQGKSAAAHLPTNVATLGLLSFLVSTIAMLLN